MTKIASARLESDSLAAIAALAPFTAGDLIYASGANAFAKLPKGAVGQILKMKADLTAPQWVDGLLQTKAWGRYSYSPTTYTKVAGAGISGISRSSAGVIVLTWSTAFADTNYQVFANCRDPAICANVVSHSTTTATVRITNMSPVAAYDGPFDVFAMA